MDFELARSTAARTAPPRGPDGARPDRRPPALVRPMVSTHADASQIIDLSSPPRARGFDPAPTARIAADNTSIRPADLARSRAGFPFASRRNVLSLMALAKLIFGVSESLFVRIAD